MPVYDSYRTIWGRSELTLFCFVFTLNVNGSDVMQDRIVPPLCVCYWSCGQVWREPLYCTS